MKICFYNLYHIGDLLYNKSILFYICKSNPNLHFYMLSRDNSYLFSDIPNLEHNFINSNIIYPFTLDPSNYIIHHNGYLYINLWIGVASIYTYNNLTVGDLECNLENQFIFTKNLLDHIYNLYDIRIQFNYDFTNKLSLLPIIPDIDISDFINWYNTHKQYTLIMYYNYTPQSGQKVPFTSHNTIITYLAKNVPNSFILLPTIPNDLQEIINHQQIHNIINCSTLFDCTQTKSGKHIIKLTKICGYCNYSIHYDIGACLYYMNQDIYNTKNLVLHIGYSDLYYNKWINNFHEYPNRSNDKIKFLECNEDQSIISQTTTILNHIIL